MCLLEASRYAFAYMVRVNGQYDLAGFQNLTAKLGETGGVKNLFFSEKSENMDAAATFDVRTDLSKESLRAILASVSGVTSVNVEDNGPRSSETEEAYEEE